MEAFLSVSCIAFDHYPETGGGAFTNGQLKSASFPPSTPMAMPVLAYIRMELHVLRKKFEEP
jgi:hypothetical protein